MYNPKWKAGKLVYVERVGFKRLKTIDGTLRLVTVEHDQATYSFDKILYSGEKMKKFETGGLVNFKGKTTAFEIEEVSRKGVKINGDWWWFSEVEHYEAIETKRFETPVKVVPAGTVPNPDTVVPVHVPARQGSAYGHPSLTPALPDPLTPPGPDIKDTNPKDAAASTRLDISVFPDTAVCYGALAFTEGAYKYAAYNYRESGVNASVYYSSTRRHLMKWYNGEWADQKTGVPHLASALAGIAVLIEGHEMGNMNDDRPPRLDLSALLDAMEGKVKKLQELFPNAPPRCKHESD